MARHDLAHSCLLSKTYASQRLICTTIRTTTCPIQCLTRYRQCPMANRRTVLLPETDGAERRAQDRVSHVYCLCLNKMRKGRRVGLRQTDQSSPCTGREPQLKLPFLVT